MKLSNKTSIISSDYEALQLLAGYAYIFLTNYRTQIDAADGDHQILRSQKVNDVFLALVYKSLLHCIT